MRQPGTPGLGPDHGARLAELAGHLDQQGVDAALIVQNVDMFYYTGSVPNGVLVVTPSGGAVLGVIKGLARARVESSLPAASIVPFRSYRQIPDLLKAAGVDDPGRVGKVGLEQDVLPMAMGRRLLKPFPNASATDVSPFIRRQRAVKDRHELAVMHEAARLHAEVFDAAHEIIRPGRTELEIAADMEREMRLRGHQGLLRMRRFNSELHYGAIGTGRSTGAEQAFDGPVGVTGLYPAVPQLSGRFEVGSEDTFMLDLVFGVGGYMVDTARLYTFGRPDPDVERAHKLALEIQNRAAAAMVPGAVPEEIYEAALAAVRAEGLEAEFMGWGPNKVRFLGHGVGLEIDELPVVAARFKEPLLAGMTVALEPKFFFGEKKSAGLENTFVVRPEGPAECLIPHGHEIRIL